MPREKMIPLYLSNDPGILDRLKSLLEEDGLGYKETLTNLLPDFKAGAISPEHSYYEIAVCEEDLDRATDLLKTALKSGS